MLDLLFQSLWFILPAYIANMTPVFISKINAIQKYNRPIDGGEMWLGKPILGPGKTWFGLISGALAGALVGYLQGLTSIEPISSAYLGFMLGLGALVGDSAGSFIKRRRGIKRGGKAPLMDQLGFVLIAFLFAGFIGIFDWRYLVIAVIITPALHLGTNIIGYRLKLKNEPW